MKSSRIYLLAILVVLTIAWALTPSVVHFVVQEYLIRAQNGGLKLRVDALRGHRIGVEAEGIEGWINIPIGRRMGSFPLSLKADRTVADLKVPLLFPWSPGLHFESVVYAGRAEGDVKGLTGDTTLTMSIAGLDLSLHPQIRAFGVNEGVLDAKTQGHPLRGVPSSDAHYSLQISGFSIDIPPTVRGFIKIDSVSDGNLNAQVSLGSDGKLTVSSFQLTSSLGTASLNGKAMLVGKTLKDVVGNLVVDLNTEQGSKVRPWLALLVPMASTGSEGPLRCNFRSTSCAGSGAMQLQLGIGCITVDCGARGS